MRHSAHITIPIAVLQIIVVIVGVFVKRLSFTGMENQAMAHPRFRIPLLIRHCGFLLLLVPLLWTCVILWLENRPASGWSRLWTLVSGLMLLAALSSFLYTYAFRGLIPMM